jgi:hypothetical protein
MEEYPSGQRGQTVNLLIHVFGGSNPPSSTRQKKEANFLYGFAGIAQLVERQPSKLNVVGSNPISRSVVVGVVVSS